MLCDRYTFDFRGTVSGSTIRGTMDQGGFVIEPARLVRKPILDVGDAPNTEEPLNFAEHQKLLVEASDEKSKAISLLDHYKPMREFCEAYPQSPLSIILYHGLAHAMPRKVKTEAEVQKFAQAYLKRAKYWGKPMEMLAEFNLGKSLAEDPRFADLGLNYLNRAEAQMDAAKKTDVRRQLDYFRKMAEDAKTRQQADEAFAEAKAGDVAGWNKLRKLSKNSPFDPVLTYLRAEAARLNGKPDEALEMNARLAVWPRLQATLQAEPVWQAGEQKLPESLLLEGWVKKHGSEAGLTAYKNQTYEEAIHLIAKQIGPPPAVPAGNRLSVMELFTGTNCPPCLAADLAISALEKRYSPSHLLVLRYHLHTNGLDPLTHPRNLERFENLLGPDPQGQFATPSVFLNGQPAKSPVGGYLDNATEVGKNLEAELRPVLPENSPLKLNLSAYRHEGEISISAKLTGVPDWRNATTCGCYSCWPRRNWISPPGTEFAGTKWLCVGYFRKAIVSHCRAKGIFSMPQKPAWPTFVNC